MRASGHGTVEVRLLLTIALRTLFFYSAVLFMMRIMGKREIGNLSPFDLVVSIMIAELAALPIENHDKPLIEGVLPLAILLTAEVALSYWSLKSEKVRAVVNGTPSIVVMKGVIIEEEMRRNRYNLNDLMVGLRSKGVVDLADVEFAVLEPPGTLSVIPLAEKRPVTPRDMNLSVSYEGLPVPLITDGRVHWDQVREAGYSQEQFMALLNQHGVSEAGAVLFAYMDSARNFKLQLKGRKIRN